MSAEKMDLVRQQVARVYAARDYAFTVSTDLGHEWTDADIAALTAPGKFLPGLARLMGAAASDYTSVPHPEGNCND